MPAAGEVWSLAGPAAVFCSGGRALEHPKIASARSQLNLRRHMHPVLAVLASEIDGQGDKKKRAAPGGAARVTTTGLAQRSALARAMAFLNAPNGWAPLMK